MKDNFNEFGDFLYGVFSEFKNKNIEDIKSLIKNIDDGNMRIRRYYKDYDKRIYHYGVEDISEKYPSEVHIDFAEINWRLYKVFDSDKDKELSKIDQYNLIRLLVYISKNSDRFSFSGMFYDYASQKHYEYTHKDQHKMFESFLSVFEYILREYSVEELDIDSHINVNIYDDLKANLSKFREMRFIDFAKHIENKYLFECTKGKLK